MTTSRIELLVARASDGLATLDELDELATLLEDDAAAPLGELLREEAGVIDVIDAVMSAIEPEYELLSAYADGQLDGERREAVSARLSRDPAARAQIAAFAQISSALSEGIQAERGPTPAVWPAVAARLGIDPEAVPGWDGALLREAVRAEAGVVNVVPEVQAALRPTARVAAAEPSFGDRVRAWLSTWSLPALGFAAAAALLLSFPNAAPQGSSATSFRVAPINHVQIEDISTDQADAMVQVLQFDEDSPTIIFIEEGSSGDQGATL